MSNRSGLLENQNMTRFSDNSAASKISSDLKQTQMDHALESKLTTAQPDPNLTKREKEVLKFILDGKTNREIAQKLYRTERTVEYHRNRLMCKLGTHNIVELVKYAIAIGIA